MKELLEILEKRMTTPTNYGWFHIMFICFLIITCIIMVLLARKASSRQMRTSLIIISSIMFLLEIYKQFIYTFDVSETGEIVADYQWYAFPFQLCSTPMYILLIAGIIKPGKLQDALASYLAFFSLFGGLCVYVFPNDVFTSIMGISIQTMIHHGLQIVSAVYIITYYRKQFGFKFLLKSFPVFLANLLIAMVLNLIVPLITSDTFNMFYISPYFDCTLPVLSLIYPKVPYIVFFFIYTLGFCLAVTVVFYLAKGIMFIINKLYAKVIKIKEEHETKEVIK